MCAPQEDAIVLTTYFGERSRARGRLLADELLDIHAQHELRSSVLLRGIQGFGAKHGRRSDRLLTLSEDLPLVSVAIDARARIDAVLQQMKAIGHAGLTTLERARFGRGAEQNGRPPGGDCPQGSTNAVKLTVYLGRHQRIDGSPAFVTVCQALHDSGVAGATVLLGVDGTVHGHRERARFFARNANVPLMVVAVGDAADISRGLVQIERLLAKPLFTTERVRVCKRDGALLQPPLSHSSAPEHDLEMQHKLTVIVSEAARHEHRAVYLELVRRLREARCAGATSVRGIWGFHGEHPPHGDRLLALRRHVPVITTTIDTPEKIAQLFGIVDELTRERGLVTSELVPSVSSLHAPHDHPPRPNAS
jgi:PII-like signaling protein